jgi:hypothetical protein
MQNGTPDAPEPRLTPFTFKIIALNDFHGNPEFPGNYGQTASATDKPALSPLEMGASSFSFQANPFPCTMPRVDP